MPDDDRPEHVAFNQAAPPGERFDANAELNQRYKPLASQLLPDSSVQQVIDYITDGLDDAESMEKASNILTFPGTRLQEAKRGRGMKSVIVDDLQVFTHGEYYERPTFLGFDALRTMVDQTPILSAVIMTRVRQVSRFCQLSEDGGPGFEIRHVDRKHELTATEQESTELLGRFMANCGWEWNPRKREAMHRDTFMRFMAKQVRDTLTLDSMPIETEQKRNRSLGMDGFYPVDGATIRMCTENGYRGDDSIFALQVVEGRVVTAYTRDNLIYVPRNPRTDVKVGGYGLSETELLIRIVTGWLNALNTNSRGFDENSIPFGLLHLSGDYGPEDIAAFRRYWNAMVKGVNNRWTLPVLVSKDQESKANFERFGIEFNEMMFAKWMVFLQSIVCALYGMDPSEINSESFGADKSGLSGSDTAERLATAKDKGFRPLMSYHEGTLSDFIVGEFANKYVLRFVGVEDDDAKAAEERKKLVLTVNEMRAEDGYEVWPGDKLGDAPVNPSLMGPWMQFSQPQQQMDFGQPEDQQGGEQGGPPGQQGGQPGGGGQGHDDDEGDFGGGSQGGQFGKSMQIVKIGGV